MQHYLLTTVFALFATCSAYASGKERVKVETLHRIASENAACLEGCRILGKHVIKTAGTPEKMGKFIARSLIHEAISLHGYSSLMPLEVRQFRRMRNFLSEYNRELSRSGHFDIDGFIGKVEELQDYTTKSATELGNANKKQFLEMLPPAPGHNSAHSLKFTGSLTVIYDRKVNRLAKLLENAKTYRNAISSGSGFILSINTRRKRYAGLDITRGISITRLAGSIFFIILGEFFFSERVSAASLDDFDVEVSSEEYEVFYSAVEMERDRLLSNLENSDDPEDREVALEIRSEIEEERD